MALSRMQTRRTEARRAPRRLLQYLSLGMVGLVLLLGALGSSAYLVARQSLPQITGEAQIAGLSAVVSVYRDTRGVPHIEAATMRDLYMAQGYVTAQDRLWQMDMTRRAGHGRLAEVMGAGLVQTDKYFRSLTLTQAAELSMQLYSAETRSFLEAYAAGVNAFITTATQTGRLPVEFRLLGYRPEPWAPIDSVIIGKVLADDLGGNWKAEVFRYQLREVVDEVLFKQILPIYPQDGPTIMRYAGHDAPSPRTVTLPPRHTGLDLSHLAATAPVVDPFVGSNNWVLAGNLTKSGKPLLANDPHLALRTPSIWHQVHLMVTEPNDPMNVSGVIFPGAPGIIIGHNEYVAWGVTNTGPDVQDLYIERRNPENPYQFEFQGEWEDALVIDTPIRVRGKPDVPFEVMVTRHGPIISEIAGDKENRPKEALALQWTALQPTTELEAVIGMNRARDWVEFREALKGFFAPTQNFVFAAVDGTIAYRANGLVPIRAKGDGLLPVPGWDGEYEWLGYIPFNKMPEVINPREGFIASANNKVVDDAYPHLISHTWAQPYRQQQIIDVITGKNGHTVADMQALQTDYTNQQAVTLLPILLPRVQQGSPTKNEQVAFTLLEQWDHVDDADQAAPLLYHFWWKHLTVQLYEEQMGKELYRRFGDVGNVTDHFLRAAAAGQENEWLKQVGGLERLATESFVAAVAEVAALQGRNPAKWAWGRFHQIQPPHPIGSVIKPLGWLLHPTAYPVGGSGVTVGAMSFNRETGKVSSAGPWRQVVDLNDPLGNSLDILTPGQSGHFLSPWYQDQAAQHASGNLWPKLMTLPAYRTGAPLILKP